MKSFDEIKSILETDLNAAMAAHEAGSQDLHLTGQALAQSIERYRRFILHGMIPEDLDDSAI